MSVLTPQADYQPNLKARRRGRGRYSVVLIRCPDGWKPKTPRSMPPAIVSARFAVRNIRATEAAAIAQGFNLAHYGEHFGGEMAVVASTLFAIVNQPVDSRCRCGVEVTHEA